MSAIPAKRAGCLFKDNVLVAFADCELPHASDNRMGNTGMNGKLAYTGGRFEGRTVRTLREHLRT